VGLRAPVVFCEHRLGLLEELYSLVTLLGA
jgi:hypothetical protein